MLQHEWNLKILCQVKEARHRKTNTSCFHSHEAPKVITFTETESGIEVTRASRGRESLFNRYRVLVGKDEKVLPKIQHSRNGYTTL